MSGGEAARAQRPARVSESARRRRAAASAQRTRLVPAQVKRLEVHGADGQLALALRSTESRQSRRNGAQGVEDALALAAAAPPPPPPPPPPPRAPLTGCCVGTCEPMRSCLSMCSSVVLPALSRPRNRILASLE